ncbi:MAG TPA: HAMP domain-containing protein [Candidatus Eisenbacteria bacterium]|nr:HAMP domain-containing protein [Candidatus Eisenbacteria bacterium]
MNRGPDDPSPTLSLGVRVALFTSLSVLTAVLVAALAVEASGRTEARRAASEQLRRAHTVAASRLARDGESLRQLAATVARDPKFFALLALRRSERSTSFRQSLEGVIREFQTDARAEIFDVTDEWGATIAASTRPAAPEPSRGDSPLVRHALAGHEALGYRLEGGRLYRIAVVPVLAGERAPIGTLTLGTPIDDSFASVVHSATGADLLLLAGEVAARGGATAKARPIVTTLSPAGARSVLETLGPSPRSIGRSRLRDERAVWIAKTPALALDVSLDGAMEGGVGRLIVAAPLGVATAFAPLRETLLAAGAIAAACSLLVGFLVGRRMSRRLRRLGAATREAGIGNYDVPLPAHASDEIGRLTADFDAMRESQRREVERLVELDKMKSDFLAVVAQEILAPALEIQEAGDTLARRAAPALGPEGIKRLRLIQGGAESLARLAQDLGGASVVLSAPAAAAAVPSSAPRSRPSNVKVVPGESEFRPTSAAPAPPAAPASAPAAPDVPVVPEAPTSEVDIARLVEGVAVDLLVAGAERGIEVEIAVEPDLVHPSVEAGPLEAALREHGERAIAALSPGSSVTFAARRAPSAIEIRIEGGASDFEISLPLAQAAPDTSSAA